LESYHKYIIKEHNIAKAKEHLIANDRLTDQTVLPFVLDNKIYYHKGGETIVGSGYLIET
jgi:hypothetical protein